MAVVDRTLTWQQLGDTTAVPPLSVHWTFAEPADHGWQLPGGRPAPVEGDALVATGTGRAVLMSPSGFLLDGELQQWLTWVSRTEHVDHVIVSWRGAGQPFSPMRSTSPLLVESQPGATPDWQTYTLPLASLRGVRDATDASEGLEQLKLTFVGKSDDRVRVELQRVSAVSDYDQTRGDTLVRHALRRGGERRHGVVLRAGRSATLSIVSGAGDRLRLALAASGASKAVEVTLHDTTKRLPDQHWSLPAGAPWQPLAIDLPDCEGRPLQLQLHCAPSPSPRAALLVGGPLHLAPRPDEHPNVLLYVEDTLRRDRLSIYGHERLTDPALAAIAAAGIVFEDTLAASSWTRPSISSLLTSLSPLTHGNRTHLDRVADEVTTLAEAFADAGYLTASFVTNYHGGAWSGLDQGFDIAREPTADGASSVASTLTSAVIADSLERLLAEHVGERLFVHVHTLDPHEPYRPEQDDLAALGFVGPPEAIEAPLLYEAEVRHNDRWLGALDATLRRLQLADNTLLAFTSDHGEAFGEHGARGHRKSLHGEELDVPLVLRWPAELAAGRRIEAAVAHIDLAPTLLGLAGVEVPSSWQGRDLSDLARGVERGLEPGRAATADDLPRLASCVYGDDQLGRPAEVAVVQHDGRGAEYKLLATLDDEGRITPRALYRLDRDPAEEHDLLGAASGAPHNGEDPAGTPAADPELAEILHSLSSWLADTVARDLAAGSPASADPMDPATRDWMLAMGYLGR